MISVGYRFYQVSVVFLDKKISLQSFGILALHIEVDTIVTLIRRGIFAILITQLAVMSSFAKDGLDTQPKRFLIYYISIGFGHERAAEAIRDKILARDPSAKVTLQDITQFSPSMALAWVNTKLYGAMVKHAPQLWDAMYERSMAYYRSIRAIKRIHKPYNERAILKNIETVNPDMIISTYSLSTESLISLRQENRLPKGINISWVHTDYVVENYYQLISKEIDMTFLPHKAMEKTWIEANVPASKVMTAGMPVNPAIYESFSEQERVDFMSQKGLDAEMKTIFLMSGKEGVGNFYEVVKGIASQFSEPIQIIAACGLNKAHQIRLSRMELPSNVKLVIEGLIPNEKVLKYIKSSDLYVTKSGGVSPTEAAIIGKPMVLMDVNGGPERYNAKFFLEQGMAKVTDAEATVGILAKQLLDDKAAQEAMIAAQKQLRAGTNLELIVDYLFQGVKIKNGDRLSSIKEKSRNGTDFIRNNETACERFYSN